MRYYVRKKHFIFFIWYSVFCNLIFAILIILLSVFEIELKFLVIMYILIFVATLDFFAIRVLRFCGSQILFEETVVKCMFLNRTRKVISYNEIKDYGVFYFQTNCKFIYISRMELNKAKRISELRELNARTDDVLILEYKHEVLEYLKTKIRGEITPCLPFD